MNEIWILCDFDRRYEVSNLGRVRRLDNLRVRKPSVSKNGYHLIVFSTPGGKHRAEYVHRLVANAFIKNPNGFDWVSHIDGDRSNNSASNLLFESRSENMRRKVGHGTNNDCEKNGSAKLTNSDVNKIVKLRGMGAKLKPLSVQFGVSISQISKICLNNNWRRRGGA